MAVNCGVGVRESAARTPLPKVTGAAFGTVCAGLVAAVCAQTDDAVTNVDKNDAISTRVMIVIGLLLDHTNEIPLYADRIAPASKRGKRLSYFERVSTKAL